MGLKLSKYKITWYVLGGYEEYREEIVEATSKESAIAIIDAAHGTAPSLLGPKRKAVLIRSVEKV